MKPKSSETNRELGKEALEKIKEGYTYKGKQTIKPAEKSEEKLYLMVMDYIEGNDLREFMMKHFKRSILFPLPISAFIISRISRALEYAHAIIVHRDLSPENILINKQGVAKLTDFGIAVAISQEGTDFAGKLQYMSPEQFSRQKIDARSDIFALGLMAYQLATGISIFQPIQNLTFEEQYKHIRDLMRLDIVPPHEICTDIPKEYSNIIMKMLAFKKTDRYQSMVEVTNDLERKYLYAKGFGPTNQSLQAYLDVVNKDFKDTDQEQLRKLSFLANESKKIQLRRKINESLYTKVGLSEAKTRGALSVLAILKGQKIAKTE
jgi:serine/threonine protein kinase